MEESRERVLGMFERMKKDALDLHELFEAGGNDPEERLEVFYVVEGTATLVTGGTMVGGKVTQAGQSRGTDIRGGDTRRLSKGDVIVIPALL